MEDLFRKFQNLSKTVIESIMRLQLVDLTGRAKIIISSFFERFTKIYWLLEFPITKTLNLPLQHWTKPLERFI